MSIKNNVLPFINRIVRILGRLISIMLVGGSFLALYFFGKSFYSNFFISPKEPYSIRLKNFDSIKVTNSKDCEWADIGRPQVELVIDSPVGGGYASKTYMQFETNAEMDFRIELPDGKLSAMGFYADNTDKNLNLPLGADGLIAGKATQIKVEYVQLSTFYMSQFFCGPEVTVERAGPEVRFTDRLFNKPKSVHISQYFKPQDKISITIINPDLSNVIDTSQMHQLSLEFIADGEYPSFSVAVIANDLMPVLPVAYDNADSFGPKAFNIYSNNIEIKHPVGTYKVGNTTSAELPELTLTSEDILSIHSNSGEDVGYTNQLILNPKKEFEITGITKSFRFNNEEKIKARWYTLPDYVQAGLFGILLSIVGGIWSLRKSLISWMVLPFTFDDNKMAPPKGSFFCVTHSGVVIAGELVGNPSQDNPYYVIKNARRKLKPSDPWEEEVILEIKVRADAVEQAYVV